MSEAFSLHKVGTPGEPRLALFEVLQSVSQPFSLSFVVDTHYSHWKFMSHIPIYILSIIYVTIRCNSTQKYFRKLWVRYQGLLSCLKTVRFSLVWGREEPQHHTRIILYFVKNLQIRLWKRWKEHYQQKEDSYIGVDCLHVFLLTHFYNKILREIQV